MLFLELGAFFSLLGLLIRGRLWIRNRGKCPSVVLALEIIEPFFTYGQSNSVHILIFLLIAWGYCWQPWDSQPCPKLFSNRLDFVLSR